MTRGGSSMGKPEVTDGKGSAPRRSEDACTPAPSPSPSSELPRRERRLRSATSRSSSSTPEGPEDSTRIALRQRLEYDIALLDSWSWRSLSAASTRIEEPPSPCSGQRLLVLTRSGVHHVMLNAVVGRLEVGCGATRSGPTESETTGSSTTARGEEPSCPDCARETGLG